ncbi:MAG: hypothetical protein AB8F26_05405 [Phycisphaerales bacterium]
MNKLALLALVGVAGTASADLLITEAYAGITGEDGTADWFEVTWTGAGTFDTGILFYDDESADPTVNAGLTSFILNTGESAIFLQDSDAAGIADFVAVWGPVANVGIAAGGGGLSQNGDGIFLFDGNTAGANEVASVLFDGSDLTDLIATIVFDAAGNASSAELGVDGAFASAAFFNDNIGGPEEMVSLVGSPGVVPSPGTIALLGLGGLVVGRRRR